MEIAGYPFFSMKSYADVTLMTLFDEGDRRVFTRRVCERNRRAWCVEETDTEEERAYCYWLDAEHAKRRLDILGFTVSKAEQEFEAAMRRYRHEVEEGGLVSGLYWLPKGELPEFLARYSFAKWAEAIQKFVSASFVKPKPYDREDVEKLDPVLRLLCEDNTEDFFYGFPSCDPRLFIRAALEAIGLAEPLVLDYSELVHSGYHTPDEALALSAKTTISWEFTATAKIIVLTEGTTDAAFLQQALRGLFPFLEPLYSFLDFAESNMEGGAANLVRVVKGFVAAGVVNRVIAVFDNDTAASVALRSLQSVAIPENVSIIRYPPVPYATAYPTIGPQGNVLMDVNGLAGSIELYFGLDVLRRPDGELTPVQWRGYDQTLQQYQGELIDKGVLQEAFQRKLEMCRSTLTRNSSGDWSGMQLILESIFIAFTRKPERFDQRFQAGKRG
ncbi:MAG: hypothetical protein HY735_30825 [Verrucomicrobia bacterium]|nr:hypothetical protein [Verrucomicrobiota bacterium]